MSQGANQNPSQRLRVTQPVIAGYDNPTSVPFNALEGQLYLRIGTLEIYQKQDDGQTTNWVLLPQSSLFNIPGYYPVYAGGPYPTIQGAINQAVLDGYGLAQSALVQVFAGTYNESDIVMQTGINVSGINAAACVVNGNFIYNVPAGGTGGTVATSLTDLQIIQPLGKNSLQILGAAPDLDIFVTDNLIFRTENAGETFPTIVLNAGNCIIMMSRTRVSSNASGVGFYSMHVIAMSSASQIAEGLWTCETRLALIETQASFNRIAFIANTGPVVDVGATGFFISANCTIVPQLPGPQIGINLLAAGANVATLENLFIVPSNPGSRVVAGPAGSNWLFGSALFFDSDLYDAAITFSTLDNTPTPI